MCPLKIQYNSPHNHQQNVWPSHSVLKILGRVFIPGTCWGHFQLSQIESLRAHYGVADMLHLAPAKKHVSLCYWWCLKQWLLCAQGGNNVDCMGFQQRFWCYPCYSLVCTTICSIRVSTCYYRGVVSSTLRTNFKIHPIMAINQTCGWNIALLLLR